MSGNTSSIDARPSIDVTTYNLNLDPGLHPYWTITTAMEELDHDDRTAECQLPPSRGTSRPRAAAPILHQPCQDQTREGGHAGSRGSLMAALPGDDGDPAANPVHQHPSGRVNQPRAAEQRATFPSAAACTHAGRKTEGPLYGAAAPGGGGRTGLDAEQADAAEHLPSATLGLSPGHTSGNPPRDRDDGEGGRHCSIYPPGSLSSVHLDPVPCLL